MNINASNIIPECVTLDPRLEKEIQKWIDGLSTPENVEEDDCCPTSQFCFHITKSGLGDIIKIVYNKECLVLGIDDDGEPFANNFYHFDNEHA